MNRLLGVRAWGLLVSLGGAVISLAPSSAAKAAARVSPPANWVEQLPSVSAVRSAVSGSDPADTAARQEAALFVMMDVIEGLTGVSHMDANAATIPQPAGTRWLEYHKAKSTGRPSKYPSSPAATHYYGNLNFHNEILSKLLPPAVKSAYEASGRYQDLVRLLPPALLADGRDPKHPDCAKVLKLVAEGRIEERAPLAVPCLEAQRAAAEAAAREKATQLGAKDVEKARAAGVSTSVLGVALGEPFTLPDCDAGVGAYFQGVANACHSVLISKSTTLADIVLPASKRPPWLEFANAMLDHGTVVGIAIATKDDGAADQVKALRSKYGKSGKADTNSQFLEWQLSGLYVRYEFRSALPAVPDQVTATTDMTGFTTFHVGPNAFANFSRAMTPNLFILLESLHDAKKTEAQKLKEQEPGL